MTIVAWEKTQSPIAYFWGAWVGHSALIVECKSGTTV